MDDIQRLNKQIDDVRRDLQKQIEQLKARNPVNYKSEDNMMIMKTTSTLSTWKKGDVGKIKNGVLSQFDGTETSSSVSMPVIVLNGTGGTDKNVFVLVDGYSYVMVGQAPISIGDKLMPYVDGSQRKVKTDPSGTKAFWVALEAASVSGGYIKVKFLSGGGGGGGLLLFKVTSKSGAVYLCEQYDNGMDASPSATGVQVFPLELNFADTLAAGTWIMAGSNSIGLTGY